MADKSVRDNSSVKALIDKAEKHMTRYKIAKTLGVTPTQVYAWESGREPCGPADRARLASLAGDDPVQELVRATLEKYEGTKRGDQLAAILGKQSLQTGGASVTALLALASGAYLMAMNQTDILALLNTMYRSVKSCIRLFTVSVKQHTTPPSAGFFMPAGLAFGTWPAAIRTAAARHGLAVDQ